MLCSFDYAKDELEIFSESEDEDEARRIMLETLNEVGGDLDAASGRIPEIADGETPVYYHSAISVCAERVDVANSQPDFGMAKPDASFGDLAQLYCYERASQMLCDALDAIRKKREDEAA